MADRPDDLFVRLPLVWRGDELYIESLQMCAGKVLQHSQHWFGGRIAVGGPVGFFVPCGTFSDRSAAMRAVEEAVRKALGAEPSATGAEGGGDE